MSELGVSIITCTNQSGYLNNIINNYLRQRYKRKQLIIILNKNSLNVNKWRKKVAAYPQVTIYQVPERISLGQCLNCGITQAKYPLITKFDHDDYYSPFYLKEQVKALRHTKSSVLGKHTCLVFLSASNRLIIRSPREKNKCVKFVQGGTIMFRRKVLKKVRFPDLSLGEDVKFLRDCSKKGYTIYATSPYNYVYIRRKNKKTHTWQVGDHVFLNGSQPVAKTRQFKRFAAKVF